jgi:hypothetical protein
VSFLDDLQPWRRVFFPLRAGTGVLRFAIPRWLPPFRPGLEFIGPSRVSAQGRHAGASRPKARPDKHCNRKCGKTDCSAVREIAASPKTVASD